MIITIQGVSNNASVAKLAATIGEFCALNKRKKTLILQIGNNTIDTAENFLIGETYRQNNAGELDSTNPNKGIDVLLREIDAIKLTGEMFETYCTAMCKTQNLFDIANGTLLQDAMGKFEKACGEPLSKREALAEKTGVPAEPKPMDILLEEAKNVYDVIIVAMTYCTKKVTQYFTDPKVSKYNIYLVPQGVKRRIRFDDFSGNDILVIPNYEHSSKYNVKKISQIYGRKVVYPVSHNTIFDDAAEDGTLYKFVSRNKNCAKGDMNYDWCNDIKAIVTKITGEKENFDEIPIWNMPIPDEKIKVPEEVIPQIEDSGTSNDIDYEEALIEETEEIEVSEVTEGNIDMNVITEGVNNAVLEVINEELNREPENITVEELFTEEELNATHEEAVVEIAEEIPVAEEAPVVEEKPEPVVNVSELLDSLFGE